MAALEEALVQLTDMGIPRGRAKAALARSKGDAMAAAERVFGGEFDDIASDAEMSDDEPHPSRQGLQTPASNSPDPVDQHDYGSDADAMDEDDDFGIELGEFDDVSRGQDPYAGIFFSKDRVERMIEPALEPEHAEVFIPRKVLPDSPNARTISVRILSRGEWMSGCPEGGEQSFLFQLYSTLADGSMPCSNNCGHHFPRKPEHFFALLNSFPNYTAYLAHIVEATCPKCHHVTCFACGEPTQKSSGKAPAKNDEIASLFHCSNIQGAILGVGLHMIEQAFGTTLDLSFTPTHPTKKQKLKHLMSKILPTPQEQADSGDDSDEAVFMTKAAKLAKDRGTGYSGNINEDRSGQIAAAEAQAAKDVTTATLLAQVAVYLPSLKRNPAPRTSDLMVHPTVLAHLRRRSGFVNDLLRNDSLIDMSNRPTIYRALLDWLEIVSNHEALASMLAMPSMRPVSCEPGPDARTLYITYEGSPSPRELLETIVIQVNAALRGLQSTAGAERSVADSVDEESEEQNRALKLFCERVLGARQKIDQQLVGTKGKEFVDRMYLSLPGNEAASQAVVVPSNDAEVRKTYEEWAQKARFDYCSLRDPADATKFRHYFDAQASKLVGFDLPKRSLAIAKELAVLTTNLPTAWGTSIFLRVDEDRVDIIKCMIIGPRDTPYQNGVYIFDIFLPVDYNVTCPRVQYMTTNGGQFRYNPNLYADGKVCLSLLGTWSGPGWISGQSTLLQVLVSIQALILCEEPYCNEPGWAQDAGSAASKAYSANIRRMVLMDAMANNIKNPPHPFEEEIKTHFRLKANEIRQQLDEWKKRDDGLQTAGDGFRGGGFFGGPGALKAPKGAKAGTFDAAAAQLRTLLDELSPAPPPPTKSARRSARFAHK